MHRFYVYELIDASGVVQYVGKGSGRRLDVQKRKFALDGRIVRSFDREAKAYAFEVAHIAAAKPIQNICKGGNGSTATKTRFVKDVFYRLYDQIGSRALAARLVLAYGPPESKTDAIRAIAYG